MQICVNPTGGYTQDDYPALLLPGAGGQRSEEQRGPAPAGRRAGLPAQPQRGQQLYYARQEWFQGGRSNKAVCNLRCLSKPFVVLGKGLFRNSFTCL